MLSVADGGGGQSSEPQTQRSLGSRKQVNHVLQIRGASWPLSPVHGAARNFLEVSLAVTHEESLQISPTWKRQGKASLAVGTEYAKVQSHETGWCLQRGSSLGRSEGPLRE